MCCADVCSAEDLRFLVMSRPNDTEGRLCLALCHPDPLQFGRFPVSLAFSPRKLSSWLLDETKTLFGDALKDSITSDIFVPKWAAIFMEPKELNRFVRVS